MADPAGTMARLLDAYLAGLQGDISVAKLCRVISWDEGKGRAKIQPLIKTGTDEPAMIQAIPVLGFRLKPKTGGASIEYVPDLKPNDVVLAVVADHEIRNGMTGSVAPPDSTRQHDVNDAIIVGILF